MTSLRFGLPLEEAHSFEKNWSQGTQLHDNASKHKMTVGNWPEPERRQLERTEKLKMQRTLAVKGGASYSEPLPKAVLPPIVITGEWRETCSKQIMMYSSCTHMQQQKEVLTLWFLMDFLCWKVHYINCLLSALAAWFLSRLVSQDEHFAEFWIYKQKHIQKKQENVANVS